MTIAPPLFSADDARRAFDTWGANCGPGAIAAMCHRTLDELRPLMGDFESRGYTNPSLMFEVLDRIDARYTVRRRGGDLIVGFPLYGLSRIQWEGPWTRPGVPIAARYRHTHWVGAATIGDRIGIFDINCLENGSGWVSLPDWEAEVVPYLLAACEPKADGRWHITHTIEINAASVARPWAPVPVHEGASS